MRSAVEERLAAIEDTLDGLAERFEAVTRDSASTATERIAAVSQRLDELATTTFAEQAAGQEQWAADIRAALGDLADAVQRSLGSLGDSLNDALRSGQAEEHGHVDTVVGELRTAVEDRLAIIRDASSSGVADLRGFVEAFQLSTDARLEDIQASLRGGLEQARSGLVEELTTTLDSLDRANAHSRQLVETEVASLREDLADALEEVRDRIAATVSRAQEAITGSVDEQRGAFDEVVRSLRSDVLDRVEETGATTRTSLDEMRADVVAASRNSEEAAARLASLDQTVAGMDEVVSALRTEWDRRTDAAIDLARKAAEAAVVDFRAQVAATVGELRRSVEANTAKVGEANGYLSGATARLAQAGEALVAYLAQRDQILEAERDRTLHEVLDEFASGLSAKERRGIAAKVGDSLDRRRDARDAERHRRAKAGEPAVTIPEVPDPLAALTAPVQPAEPISAPPPRPAAAPSTAKKAAAPPAKKAAVKKAGAPAKKAAVKKTTPAKKAAPAAKKASGVAKKATAPAVKATAAPEKASAPAKKAAKKAAAPAEQPAATTATPSTEVASPPVETKPQSPPQAKKATRAKKTAPPPPAPETPQASATPDTTPIESAPPA